MRGLTLSGAFCPDMTGGRAEKAHRLGLQLYDSPARRNNLLFRAVWGSPFVVKP
jgi:hypothetical protein